MRLATIARRLLGAVVVAYVAACTALFFAQRTLLFPAPAPLPVRLGQGATRAVLDLGTATVPIFWQPVDGAPLVLFFHGNGGQLARSVATGRDAVAAGVGFAAVEYPGYGEATGEGPSEVGILAAARAGLAHLGTLGLPTPACMGHSLGTGVAVAMAAEGRCSALVLASAYTSIPDVAVLSYPLFPVHWLVRDPFDSLSRAGAVKVPALVVHGTRDPQIPLALGERLAAAIDGAKFVRVDRAHNDIVDRELWARVAGFLGGG